MVGRTEATRSRWFASRRFSYLVACGQTIGQKFEASDPLDRALTRTREAATKAEDLAPVRSSAGSWRRFGGVGSRDVELRAASWTRESEVRSEATTTGLRACAARRIGRELRRRLRRAGTRRFAGTCEADEDFASPPLGSIRGGSVLKFGIYQATETSSWSENLRNRSTKSWFTFALGKPLEALERKLPHGFDSLVDGRRSRGGCTPPQDLYDLG